MSDQEPREFKSSDQCSICGKPQDQHFRIESVISSDMSAVKLLCDAPAPEVVSTLTDAEIKDVIYPQLTTNFDAGTIYCFRKVANAAAKAERYRILALPIAQGASLAGFKAVEEFKRQIESNQ